MKTMLVLVLCILNFFCFAQSNILINLNEAGAVPATNRLVRFQAQSPFIGNTFYMVSDTNGLILTNLNVAVLYNGTVMAPPGPINFQLFIPVGTTGAQDWTNFWAVGGGVATYPAGAVAPSIVMADARYAQNSNSFSALFYPTSNPSGFFTGSQVTNAINALANTNSFSLQTVTNVANSVYSNNPSGYISLVPATATNKFILGSVATNSFDSTNSAANVFSSIVSSNYLPTSSASATYYPTSNPSGFVNTNNLVSATNGVTSAYTTAILNQGIADTNFAFVISNTLTANIQTTSNSLQASKQPLNGNLTGISGTGAVTNQTIVGQNMTSSTNSFPPYAIVINATNQSFLTNGYTGIVFMPTNVYLPTNSLPGLTNGYVDGAKMTNSYNFQITNAVTITSNGIIAQFPSGGLMLGNAAYANTNTMKVFASTNADYAALATNAAVGAGNIITTSALQIWTNNNGNAYFGTIGGNVAMLSLADSVAASWDILAGNSNGLSLNGNFALGNGRFFIGNLLYGTNLQFSGLAPSAQAQVTNAAIGTYQSSSNLTYALQSSQSNNVTSFFQTGSNLTYSLGQNGTNYSTGVFNSASNFTVSSVVSAFQSGSNYTLTIGQNETNYATGVFNNASNFTLAKIAPLVSTNDSRVLYLTNANNNLSGTLNGTVNSLLLPGTITGVGGSIQNANLTVSNFVTSTSKFEFQSASMLQFDANVSIIGLSNSIYADTNTVQGAVTNYANQVGQNLTNLFNANVATFANIETNALIGTNPVAPYNTNFLVLQGNGTHGANTIAPDNAGYYVYDGNHRLTNTLNSYYYTNNGIQWLLVAPTNNSSTLATWTTIGNGSIGVNAAGTPPAGITAWAVSRNFAINGEVPTNIPISGIAANLITNNNQSLVTFNGNFTLSQGVALNQIAYLNSNGSSNSILQAGNAGPGGLLLQGFLTNGASWIVRFDTNGINLIFGNSFNGNGAGLTNLQSVVIATNFIDGQAYTNTYGTTITVAAPVKWTITGVSGDVNEALYIIASPTVGGVTNYCAQQTLVTSLAVTVTNSPLVGFVPTNAIYYFTNLSSGAGDSATIIGGQIKYP